jgi:hypothetical protein
MTWEDMKRDNVVNDRYDWFHSMYDSPTVSLDRHTPMRSKLTVEVMLMGETLFVEPYKVRIDLVRQHKILPSRGRDDSAYRDLVLPHTVGSLNCLAVSGKNRTYLPKEYLTCLETQWVTFSGVEHGNMGLYASEYKNPDFSRQKPINSGTGGNILAQEDAPEQGPQEAGEMRDVIATYPFGSRVLSKFVSFNWSGAKELDLDLHHKVDTDRYRAVAIRHPEYTNEWEAVVPTEDKVFMVISVNQSGKMVSTHTGGGGLVDAAHKHPTPRVQLNMKRQITWRQPHPATQGALPSSA